MPRRVPGARDALGENGVGKIRRHLHREIVQRVGLLQCPALGIDLPLPHVEKRLTGGKPEKHIERGGSRNVARDGEEGPAAEVQLEGQTTTRARGRQVPGSAKRSAAKRRRPYRRWLQSADDVRPFPPADRAVVRRHSEKSLAEREGVDDLETTHRRLEGPPIAKNGDRLGVAGGGQGERRARSQDGGQMAEAGDLEMDGHFHKATTVAHPAA